MPKTRTRLYGLPEQASWRLPSDDPLVRLQRIWVQAGQRSAVATLPSTPVDLPAQTQPFVPSGRPPALEPIEGGGIIRGLAMAWNTPTEIRSREEGHFLEEFAAGSFSRTLASPEVKLGGLFMHGQDPSIGYKALGPVQAWESSRGLEFEISTLPVEYAANILLGVRHGAYGGASIRFATRRDNVRRNPGRSATNPLGIEERTIHEATLREISIVLWPAYGTTSVAA